MEKTRAEHLAWCKQRGLEYCDTDPREAYASMASDLGKHPETVGHAGIRLGMGMFMAGLLKEGKAMRDFINGFN